LKPGGLICVVTESLEQLETRFWVCYFPSTVEVEKKRYPNITDIINAAKTAGLTGCKVVCTDAENEFTISEDFMKLVENKGFSMFRLIDESEYQAGFTSLIKDFDNQKTIRGVY